MTRILATRHWLAVCMIPAFMAVFADCQEASAQVRTVSASGVLEHPRRLDGRPAPVVSAVTMSPDGSLMASGGDDHVVRIWDVATGRIIQELESHRDWVRSVRFSPDGRTLASAGDDRLVCFWSVETGEQLGELQLRGDAVYCLEFSPDGSHLAAVGFQTKLDMYSMVTGEVEWTAECDCPDIRIVTFSPDGRTVALGGRDGKLFVLNTADGSQVYSITAHRRRIRGISFSFDGRSIATAAEDGMLRTWDASRGNMGDEVSCRPGKAMSLVWCGDRTVACGMSTNVVRLINLDDPSRQHELKGHTGTVGTVLFDRPSGRLLSGSFDTTIRVWQPDRDIVAGRLR